MKMNIFSSLLTLSLLAGGFTSCEQPYEPEQKDWEGTTEFYNSTDEKQSTTYYKPYAGYVGDPMPFYDEQSKSFKILYLQEYRPNPVGTYHPFWGLETTDAASYTALGEILPTGALAEQDAALGTGCVAYNDADRLYYIFYTGNKHQPKAGEDAQVIMYATSPDFKTWTKNQLFRLRGAANGYSSSDFRDPCIFRDGDLWHMIVSTKVGGKGNLVEFTSPDMQEWTSAGVFMPMMWDRFYECPDVFRMGDWWYLVYSEIHKAVRRVQYFKGRTLDELKACTAGDAGLWPDDHEGFLDSRGLYAGKTASDGTNRYLWGWCPTREGRDNTKTNADSGEPEWAGSLVAHRLIQHDDGTLTLGEIEAVKAKYTGKQDVRTMTQSEAGVTIADGTYTLGENSYVLFNRLGYHNHLTMTVKTAAAGDRFGISLVRGTDSKKYYTLMVNPEGDTKRKINFEQEGEEGIGFIPAIDSYVFNTPADNIYHIDIYTDNSVLVMYINDCLCYTNRIYGMARNCWSANSYNGQIEISDIQLTQY